MNLPASPACQLVPQATIFTSRKLLEFLLADVHLVEEDFAGFLRNAAEQGVANGAGLLENFLLHEMLEAALFGHDRVPGDVLGGAADRRGFRNRRGWTPCGVRTAISPSPRKKTLRVCCEDRGNVTGDEKFVFAEADDDGRSQARGDDFIRILRGDGHQRVGAGHHFDGFQDGFFQGARPWKIFRAGGR